MKRKYRTIYISSTNKVHECICPRCKKKHKKRIFFTGIGIPRINCNTCKMHFENNPTQEEPYSINWAKTNR